MHTMCPGVPPDPVSNLQISPTDTTMELTWEVSRYIDRFNVTYNYTVKRCLETGGPFSVNISDGAIGLYTLRGLNEDSSYTITVGAINTAGSTMATTTVDTMTSGETICNSIVYLLIHLVSAVPSGIPGPINFSDINSTSITVQWTELPCSDRNGEITGYTVEYNSTTPVLYNNMVNVSESSNTRLVVGGLIPRTNYTFSVRAQGAAIARSGFTSTAIPMS